MFRLSCLLSLLVLLPIAHASDKPETYTDPKWGYEVTAPAGWTLRTDVAKPPQQFWIVRDKDVENYTPFLLGGAQTVDSPAIKGLADYVADAMGSIRKRKDAVIVSTTALTVSGLEGKLIHFSYTVEDKDKKVRVRGMAGVFYRNKVGYDLIVAATPESFPKVEQEAMGILRSFKLKGNS